MHSYFNGHFNLITQRPFNLQSKMINFTKSTLTKLQELFEFSEYRILYAKGNFTSGYCIVEKTRTIVINKFFDTEGRIKCLLELLGQLEIQEPLLTAKQKVFFKTLIKEKSQIQIF